MSLYQYYIHNKSIDLNCDLKQFVREIKLKNKRANLNNDREEIRRKLAVVSSSSSSSSMLNSENNNIYTNEINNGAVMSDYFRKSSLTQQLLGQNLQICFMNELINDEPPPIETIESSNSLVSKNFVHNNNNNQSNSDGSTPESDDTNRTSNFVSSTFSTLSLNFNSSDNSADNILTQLQTDTKKALASVPNDVRSKLQMEKIAPKKPSPIADIVGLPTYGLKRLERDQIVDMNIGQLQVIVNDLCNQIEKINEELKKMLIDRDDLYMQQDSLLVDVEDITRRIQEYIKRYKKDGLMSVSTTTSNDEMTRSSTSKIAQSASTNGLAEKINSLLHLSTLAKTNSAVASNSTNNIVNNLANSITTNGNEKNIFDNSSKAKQSFQLSNLTNKLYRFTKKN